MDRVLEQRRNEVKSLECKKEKLQKTILWIMGFKEYKKIKDIARQHVETTLKDKRALLLVTMVAIIEAFKHDPEKQVPAFQGTKRWWIPTILFAAPERGIVTIS